MTSKEAHDIARRKAVHGHNDWLVWAEKNGAWNTARISVKAIKAAMLATGTAGRWYLIAANSGVGYRYNWRIGVNMLNNAKYGF